MPSRELLRATKIESIPLHLVQSIWFAQTVGRRPQLGEKDEPDHDGTAFAAQVRKSCGDEDHLWEYHQVKCRYFGTTTRWWLFSVLRQPITW
jgi:hypothetical protein